MITQGGWNKFMTNKLRIRHPVKKEQQVEDTEIEVSGEIVHIITDESTKKKYSDYPLESDVVLIKCSENIFHKFIQKIPFLSQYHSFVVLMDSEDYEIGEDIKAKVKPVWRGFNVYKSMYTGKAVEVESL
jgi:hypothetical protein